MKKNASAYAQLIWAIRNTIATTDQPETVSVEVNKEKALSYLRDKASAEDFLSSDSVLIEVEEGTATATFKSTSNGFICEIEGKAPNFVTAELKEKGMINEATSDSICHRWSEVKRQGSFSSDRPSSNMSH